MADLNLAEGLDLLEKRTRIVRLAIIAYIVISLAEAAVAYGEMAGAVNLESSDVVGVVAGIVYLLFAAVMIGSIVLVAMWIYRAHANLRAAGMDGLEFTPGWAVGWYFIPFANLIKPFHAMRELWNRSLAEDGSYGQDADPKLKLWWGTWIVGNIASNVSMRLQGMEDGGEGTATAGYLLDIASTLVLVAAAWFLGQIVERINAAQRNGITLAHAFA